MMLFLRPVIIAILFCAALLAAPFSYLQADQADMRLPALFEELNATSDTATAEAIANQIWAIWSEHGNDERLSQNLLLGTAQMNAGSLRAAEKTFTTIIDTDPAFAEAWNKRATVYFLMGAFAQSKRDIAQTIIREPRHFGALSGLGLVETHLGNYAAALKAYEQAAALHPYLEGYEEITTALKKLAVGDPI
jgi:tetratricopeptide (TPR) repeat protein